MSDRLKTTYRTDKIEPARGEPLEIRRKVVTVTPLPKQADVQRQAEAELAQKRSSRAAPSRRKTTPRRRSN
jgi:hypothetical protein